jgi:nucleotide-binding universal stress UspA family protein
MGRTAAATAPRIVVGVTGSAASVAALTWAVWEAELRGAVLHAVHAWEPAARGRAPYAPGLREHRDDERDVATALLRSVVQQSMGAVQPGLGGAGPLLEAAEGLPVQVLLHCTAGAELLVLGGSQAADLGPVARACLRAAPCPVVAVSPEYVRGLAPGRSRRLVGALS